MVTIIDKVNNKEYEDESPIVFHPLALDEPIVMENLLGDLFKDESLNIKTFGVIFNTDGTTLIAMNKPIKVNIKNSHCMTKADRLGYMMINDKYSIIMTKIDEIGEHETYFPLEVEEFKVFLKRGEDLIEEYKKKK